MSFTHGNQNEEVNMPGQSDTEKSKVKRARVGYKKEGYGQGPPPKEYPAPPDHGGYEEPHYPEPEPVIPTASLRVTAYAAADATGPSPLEADSQRLERVDVTVEATGDAAEPFRDVQKTGSDGVTIFDDLVRQRYTVSAAAPPPGYQAPAPVEADLTEGDQESLLCLVPQPFTAQFLVYYDAARCGDPTNQECLPGVPLDIYQGGKRVFSGRSDAHGRAQAQLVSMEQAQVQLSPTFQSGNRQLQTALLAATFYPTPGGNQFLPIAYVTGLGELDITSIFLYETEDETVEVPLKGLTVFVFSGSSAVGQPLRTIPFGDETSIELSDLPPGYYTVVAQGPAALQGQVIAAHPPGSEQQVVFVAAGAPTSLTFRFRVSRGRVVGHVLDERTQQGVEGIGVQLRPAVGAPFATDTDAEGMFTFSDLPGGTYELALEAAKVTDAGGREWVPSHGAPHTRLVLVEPGKTAYPPPLLVAPDEHILTVRVLGPDDQPVPFVEVDVFDEQNNPVGTFAVDDHGEVTIRVPKAGTYSVYPGVYPATGRPRQPAARVYVNQPNTAIVRLGGGGAPLFGGPFGGGGRDTVIDVPYPVLTEGAGASGGSWGTTSAAAVSPGLAALGPSVEGTLREVLGWRPRMADPKGFLAALNQAFDLKEVQGHTEFTWKQRSYAVQHDIGAITGAQASIYSRAKVALDQVLPLLEGLKPLRADADDEDVEAARSIVKSEIEELVAELGVEGGPRVARVDTLFDLLLGAFQNQLNFAQLAGQFGQVQQIFGFQRNRINTVAEEQDFTNFLIMVEHMQSLRQSFVTQRPFFTRAPGTQPFFGTQLVLVSRSLGVVSESVGEVYRAMDSVFLGAAERQVVELTFPNLPGEPPLFVSELLSWVDQAASEQGPRLLKEGGRAGAVAFLPTLDRIERLVRNSLIPDQPANAVPAGYRTARVQRALQELADHLQETETLVQQI
jgi:hypothetical protein